MKQSTRARLSVSARKLFCFLPTLSLTLLACGRSSSGASSVAAEPESYTAEEAFKRISDGLAGRWYGHLKDDPSQACSLGSRSANGTTTIGLWLPGDDADTFPESWAFQAYDVSKCVSTGCVAYGGQNSWAYSLHQYDGHGELNPFARDYYLVVSIQNGKLQQFSYKVKSQHLPVLATEKTCVALAL